MKWIVLLGVATLGGCSLAPGGAQYERAVDAGFDTAISDIQHFNDREAFVFSKGMCAITIGAYSRLEEGSVKQGIGLICGMPQTIAPVLVVTQTKDGPMVMQMQTGAPNIPFAVSANQPQGFLPSEALPHNGASIELIPKPKIPLPATP